MSNNKTYGLSIFQICFCSIKYSAIFYRYSRCDHFYFCTTINWAMMKSFNTFCNTIPFTKYSFKTTFKAQIYTKNDIIFILIDLVSSIYWMYILSMFMFWEIKMPTCYQQIIIFKLLRNVKRFCLNFEFL